ncbi:MAG: hypothetical protein H6Q90_2420 [Deltaproteobacteria bacterium]|nr:hypothetical protein [Deltaproteobacteria bacterium]
MRRRDLLRLFAGAAVAPLIPGLARATPRSDEFFVFVHAGGGWDITLWADPRNEEKGLVVPASTRNTEVGGIRHWKPAGDSFEMLTSSTSSLRLGPAIGGLRELQDRLTIINGVSMNTVSHEDGITYATTGRHRIGGALAQSTIDVITASELGAAQLMPVVSVKFPSAFVGDQLDRRVVPLQVGSVDAVTRSFARSSLYFGDADRAAITALLTDEARSLASHSTHPEPFERLESQHRAIPPLVTGDFTRTFSTRQLQSLYPQFEYGGVLGEDTLAAAFAVEALKRDLVRCVGIGVSGFDTHGIDYRRHALQLQALFDMVATLVKLLETTRHPTRANTMLSEHTHLVVLSEFCRTPGINRNGGRDHYPNNSALIISPRFRPGVFGGTDPEQLLPLDSPLVASGPRPITPPDLLATLLGSLGIEPRRYLRDGEIVKGLLA